MKIKLLLMMVFFLALTRGGHGVEKYTLDYCIKQALEKNQDIRATEYDVTSAYSKISSAKSEFLPTFEFSGNYNRLSEIPDFSITLPQGKTLNIFPSILNNYGMNLSMKQPIFTGSRLTASYEIAMNTYQAKEHNLQEVKNNVKYFIAQYFWSLVYGIESLKVVNESIELTRNHLADAKNLMASGMGSLNNVKKVEVQLSNIELMKTSIEKNIALSKSILCKTMNLSLDTEFDPEYNLPLPEFTYSHEEITSKAIEKRPLLRSVELGLKSSEAVKKIVRSNYFPSIFLVSNYTYARPNRRIMPQKDKWAETWDAGVSVQFTLWNWSKKRMDYQAAQNDFLKVKTEYENLQRQIELDVKRIFLDIQESLEKYHLSMKMVDQAQENYRISKDKYKNGMLLNSELLDAEVDLLKSKLEVTKSIMDFNIKKAELKKTAGMED